MNGASPGPLALPRLSPLRARLCTILAARALPAEFGPDVPEAPGLSCRLVADGSPADPPAPFAARAAIFLRLGDSLWKAECDSLEALALRPELAAWRDSSGRDFGDLPAELARAVLERLLAPALDGLGNLLGCDAEILPPPAEEPAWDGPLALLLSLPAAPWMAAPPPDIRLRVSWRDDAAAALVPARLESLPVRAEAAPAPPRDARAECAVRVGAMLLTPAEAAGLRPGDVLLPESWMPDSPRLIPPSGPVLLCRLQDGMLTVVGPDAAADPVNDASSGEVAMTQSRTPEPGTTSQSPDGQSPDVQAPESGAPILDAASLAAMELPVSFELASLKLRLDEIAALAPGAVFPLDGDAASVPVLVRIGGRPAARGRLVDVGGTPGVQITASIADAAPDAPSDAPGGDGE